MMLLGALAALLAAVLVAAAAFGWLLAGQALWRPRHPLRSSPGAQAALRRHPAGRAREDWAGSSLLAAAGPPPGTSRPAGPDDDPEFLRSLERLIRGDGLDQPD